MLKNSLFLLLVLTAFFNISAADFNEENRVVLAMPGHFDKIVTNGNLTVEILFHKDHKGYVVYHTSDTVSPKLHCIVDSVNTLHISGDSIENAVISRVLVLANDTVTSVINNGSGTILIKDLPRVNDFCAISSGNGVIKCRSLSAHHLMLSDNGSAFLFLGEVKGRFIDIYGNGSGNIAIASMRCRGTRILNNSFGTISVKDLKSRRGEIINNSDGEIKVSGKARAFAVVNYSAGKINLSDFICQKISNANYGTGTITLK